MDDAAFTFDACLRMSGRKAFDGLEPHHVGFELRPQFFDRTNSRPHLAVARC